MSSLRFLTANFVESATLKNGTGGAPALNETSPYTMANAGKHERRQLWQLGSVPGGGGALDVDFDLGTTRTLLAAGIAGHRGISGAGLTSFDMKTQTGAYTPGGTWTSRTGVTNVSGLRDKGAIFNSVGSIQSVRFSLVAASIFTLGKFFVGAWDYDLGFLYSSGMKRTALSPNIEERTVGQDPVRSYVGDDREQWVLPYRAIQSADAAKLDALRALRTSFIMADKSDVFREFIVGGGQFSRTVTFEQPSDSVIDAELELEQLG